MGQNSRLRRSGHQNRPLRTPRGARLAEQNGADRLFTEDTSVAPAGSPETRAALLGLTFLFEMSGRFDLVEGYSSGAASLIVTKRLKTKRGRRRDDFASYVNIHVAMTRAAVASGIRPPISPPPLSEGERDQ